MRTFMVPVAAALSLIALPAFAATGSSSSTSSNSSNNKPQSSMQIQQDLHQSLSQAGFTDINIVPGSFLVHAKDKKGHPVEMMVSPNSVVEVSALPASPNGKMTGSHTGTSSSGQAK